MNYEDYIADALDMVSAWDLPESEFTDAVNAQAQLMAGAGTGIHSRQCHALSPTQLCASNPPPTPTSQHQPQNQQGDPTMTIRSLAEVGARLEEAAELLPGEPR